MEEIGQFEYNTREMLGHGAFAMVYKGRYKQVGGAFSFFLLPLLVVLLIIVEIEVSHPGLCLRKRV